MSAYPVAETLDPVQDLLNIVCVLLMQSAAGQAVSVRYSERNISGDIWVLPSTALSLHGWQLSLIKLVCRGVHNDASETANGSKYGHNKPKDDTEP